MRRRLRASWPLVVLTTVAVACSSSGAPDGETVSPSPTAADPAGGPAATAPSVVVVMPARAARPGPEIERERRDVEAIGSVARDNGLISSMRTVVPDRSATVADVLELLAEEGNDLVCALGPGAARAVRDVARRFPGTKFCGAPGNLADVPDNALIFDLRSEESAYLAGIAAAEAVPFAQADREATPAIIVAEGSQAARLQLAFDQGFSISREPLAPVAVRVASSPDVAFDTAELLFDAGAYLIYASAGRVELGVTRSAQGRGRLVIGTLPPTGADVTGSESGAGSASASLMFLGENLSAAFRDTIDELSAGWTGGRRSIGFANGALSLTAGDSPVWPRIAAQVLATRDALIQGTDLQIVGGS